MNESTLLYQYWLNIHAQVFSALWVAGETRENAYRCAVEAAEYALSRMRSENAKLDELQRKVTT